LIWGGAFSAPFGFAQGRLFKAVPFPVRVRIKIDIRGKIEINVNGVGQGLPWACRRECPTHMGKVDLEIKSRRERDENALTGLC
jgi:hypothetical protein